MKKKIALLLLVCTMSFCLFVGCGESAQEPAPANTPANTPAADETPVPHTPEQTTTEEEIPEEEPVPQLTAIEALTLAQEGIQRYERYCNYGVVCDIADKTFSYEESEAMLSLVPTDQRFIAEGMAQCTCCATLEEAIAHKEAFLDGINPGIHVGTTLSHDGALYVWSGMNDPMSLQNVTVEEYENGQIVATADAFAPITFKETLRFVFREEEGVYRLTEVTAVDTWRSAYIDWMNGADNINRFSQGNGALIYINDDDIPELYLNSNFGAGGASLLTWSEENGVAVCDLTAYAFDYYNRANVVIDQGGRQGSYYTNVYTIENGTFQKQAEGRHQETYDGTNIVMHYQWGGTEVSEAEYQASIDHFVQGYEATDFERFNYFDLLYGLTDGTY